MVFGLVAHCLRQSLAPTVAFALLDDGLIQLVVIMVTRCTVTVPAMTVAWTATTTTVHSELIAATAATAFKT